MDVASAFDAVRAEILGDALPERGASAFSAAAVARENLNLRCRPCLGHTQCAAINLEVGSRQGDPWAPSDWKLWAKRNPAVEWEDFEILVWTDNIFLVTSSASEAKRRTQEVANALKKKLFFNQSSLEILPSGPAEKDKIPSYWTRKRKFVGCKLLVLGCFLDSTGSTESSVSGAEDVQQAPTVAVLPTNSGGRTHQYVLQHSRDLRLVGLWLLDPVGECATASLRPGKQVSAASWVGGRKAISSGWNGSEKLNVRLILCGASLASRPCGTKRWRRSTGGRDAWPEKQTPTQGRRCSGVTRSGGRS